MAENKLSGKGKKALNKLTAITAIIEETNGLKKQLKNTRDSLMKVIQKRDEFEEIKAIGKPKRRSMMYKTLPRIEFICNQLKFYIDFTIVNSDSNGLIDIKGNIIYGAYRPLCFTECIFPVSSNKNNTTDNKNMECRNCEMITRCDRLEDKPLLQFTVDRNGLIKSGSELDDEWWIKEKRNEDLFDLHIRAVDYIWGKALDWTNENILP